MTEADQEAGGLIGETPGAGREIRHGDQTGSRDPTQEMVLEGAVSQEIEAMPGRTGRDGLVAKTAGASHVIEIKIRSNHDHTEDGQTLGPEAET